MKNRKNQSFIKKYLLWITLLLVLLIPLFFLRQLTEEQQIVEREAAGSGEVRMHIQPTNITVNPGQHYETNIVLTKTVDRTIIISGAQAVLTFDTPLSVVSEQDISCGPQFNGLVFKQISGQSVTIMCTVNPGASNFINLTSADVILATVMVTVNNTAGQDASIQFTATRVTEANDTNLVPDVSTAGETATYTISNSQATATPTPSPTVIQDTPTATPTVTFNCENQKIHGDLIINKREIKDMYFKSIKHIPKEDLIKIILIRDYYFNPPTCHFSHFSAPWKSDLKRGLLIELWK